MSSDNPFDPSLPLQTIDEYQRLVGSGVIQPITPKELRALSGLWKLAADRYPDIFGEKLEPPIMILDEESHWEPRPE